MNKIEIRKIDFNTYIELLSVVGFVLGFLAMPILLLRSLMVDTISSVMLLQLGLVIITPLFYAMGGILIAVITYVPFNMMLKFKKGMAISYDSIEEEV